jgi:hypothetical protein
MSQATAEGGCHLGVQLLAELKVTLVSERGAHPTGEHRAVHASALRQLEPYLADDAEVGRPDVSVRGGPSDEAGDAQA